MILQFMRIHKLFGFNRLILLITLLFITGCGVTDSDHDEDHEEHEEAIGFVLLEGDTELIRYENGKAGDAAGDYFRDNIDALVLSPDVVNLSDSSPSGMTPTLTVRWIAEDGDLFDLHTEDNYWLSWEWDKDNTPTESCNEEARTDPETLDQLRPANIEQHLDEDSPWQFHFRADHAGTDRIRFRLMHNDHDDFRSDWMDLAVADDDHPRIDENGIYQHNRDRCRADQPEE
ncbi:MAG: hypothetical protein WD315_01610 [Balneolaceae bacterium]